MCLCAKHKRKGEDRERKLGRGLELERNACGRLCRGQSLTSVSVGSERERMKACEREREREREREGDGEGKDISRCGWNERCCVPLYLLKRNPCLNHRMVNVPNTTEHEICIYNNTVLALNEKNVF